MILWLTEITAKDFDRVGSKACRLAQIAQAGFCVPAGFCITSEAYSRDIANTGLLPSMRELVALPADRLQEPALRLQDAMRKQRMGTATAKTILNAYQRLAATTSSPMVPVAVRSSATTEDLPAASFAGQQATLLNVRGEQQLLDAVLECWASLWSPRAVTYRAHANCQAQLPAMAVLVQLMVNAEAAGVAFSVDPTSGQECVIVEAAYGLGETVVDGENDLDRYVLSRETAEEVEEPAIAHKVRQRIMARDGGLQSVELPTDLRDARVLSPEQARDVAGAALSLEQHFGCPQDIEWALAGGRLFILQARPITASWSTYFTDILAGDDQIWTSGFLNERFSRPVSPLGWSTIRELLEELAFRDPLRYLGMRNVEELCITRLYRGHPYVNMLVFQTFYRVFPRLLLPDDAYRYFPGGRTELRRSVRYPRSIVDPRFLLSMARHFVKQPKAWSPWHNHRLWRAFAERHEQRSQQLAAEYDALRESGATAAQIWETIDKAQRLNAELLSLHRWSLTYADLTYSLLRRLVQAWVAKEGAVQLCTRLVTGFANKSLDVDSALRTLSSVKEKAEFQRALLAFLAQYGHRSFHLDVYYPTFADEPAQVIDLVQRLASQPASALEDLSALRRQALQTAHKSLGRGPVRWLKRIVFDHVMHMAQRYMPLREEQRFLWQRTLAVMRRLFLLMGQRMAENGILKEPDQVFSLTKDELGAYATGHADGSAYAAIASARARDFHDLQQAFDIAPSRAYPPFLRGNRPLETEVEQSGRQLAGRGVSPGLGKGRAIVLFSPRELGRVRKGDVLVARSVDPGWTPIFTLLNGLVLEHGGQLSHAAVVAREYGLPTVAGIPAVTSLIHDGDSVLVDGLHGLIVLQSPD